MGRPPRPIYRVFVSSTWLDLQPERRALLDALQRMEEMRFVGMEFFGNRPDNTHDASLDQVDGCDVLVGVIGFRHGSGITEAEYRRARARGLPCFIYFKRAVADAPTDEEPERAAKLAAFKTELLRSHTVKEFSHPEELAANATADLHNWVASRWVVLDPPAAAPAPRASPPGADHLNLCRLLDRVEHDWIQGVLEASLHHRAWLELGLAWRDQAVEHPWERIVVAPDRPIGSLPRADSIAAIYAAAHNTLLVLGEPGAGKTTTLLELARDLIARARRAGEEPPPVVLALTTWESGRLADWIVAELGLRYQVPKRIARDWVEGSRLALLLDGLDEVPAARREACVDAINAFARENPPPGLAVTCRVAEYDALATKLRLRAAICLQPLSPEQVDRHLAAGGEALAALRRTLHEDAGLRELARTPLMLSVMMLAWHGTETGATAIAPATDPEGRRRQVFDAYVHAALHRRGKVAGGEAAARLPQVLHWLAQRMQHHGQTLFVFEQLQPGWLGGGRAAFYFLATRLATAVLLAVPFAAWQRTPREMALLLGLGALVGTALGALDLWLATRSRAQHRANVRFVSIALFLVGTAAAWIAYFVLNEIGRAAHYSGGLGYLLTAGIAFCVSTDVRELDVKPAASVHWSWRRSLQLSRLAVSTGVGFFVLLYLASLVVALLSGEAASFLHGSLGDGTFASGAAVSAVLVAGGWWRFRPERTPANLALAAALIVESGLVGLALATPAAWFGPAITLIPAAVLAVFGGFTATMVDPSRQRPGGAWFWLRVPLQFASLVGGLALIPIAVDLGDSFNPTAEWFQRVLPVALIFPGLCALAAFIRSGGFNGLQHAVLRWLLARSGELPRNAPALFEKAAQLALLQKVGFGYRFVHALLLDHFARRPEPARPG